MADYNFAQLLQEAKAGAAWPIGDYDFEVADAMAKKTANGDKEMVVTKLRCLVGPYANKTVTNNFVLSPDSATALAIWFRHMNAFGLDDSFFAQIGSTDSLAPVANALKGRRARITLAHRTWNGALQNDIAAVKPIDGVGNTLPPNGAVAVAGPPPAPGSPPPPPPAPAAQVAPPPPPAQPTAPPPPPPAPVEAPPAPVTPPAPPPTVPPAPPPQQAPAVADPAPAGYTQELWDSIPDAAKAAIRASAPAAAVTPTAAPADATAVPPPPPPLPV